MTQKVLLLRPRTESLKTAILLKQAGHHALISPLLKVMPSLEKPLPSAEGYIFTSQHAVKSFVRALQKGIHLSSDTKLYAVGEKTASALRGLGDQPMYVARGEGKDLISLIQKTASRDDRLLHLSGNHRAVDVVGALRQEGFQALYQEVYHTTYASRFSAKALKSFQERKIKAIFFYSPNMAETFVKLAQDAHLPCLFDTVYALSLSEAIQEKVSMFSWRASRISLEKTSESLIQQLGLLSAPSP